MNLLFLNQKNAKFSANDRVAGCGMSMMVFRLIFLLLCVSFPWIGKAADNSHPKIYGALEHWSYEPDSRQLTVSGWVLAGEKGLNPPLLRLSVSGEKFENNNAKWIEREDVSATNPAMGGQTGVGFSWEVSLSKVLPAGVHPVVLEAIYQADGDKATLQSAFSGPPVIVIESIRPRHWWTLGILLCAVALLGSKKLQSLRGLRRGISSFRGRGVYILIIGSFTLLVGAGITGSSVGLLLQSPHGASILDSKGSNERLFSLRPIRGDEWGVLMPNVLAQIHHEPKFPVVNTNIGLNGQNMGVIGMTGVPIYQLAALARPATWGYFFLPLRQAMSWQWQLPFWGGLLSVWLMLNLIRKNQRGLNFGLALSFCVAPYAAAWSNWPLYATMFPAIAFVVACRLLTVASVWKAVLLGLALGWAVSGWFLVLYPTWVIVIGSILLLAGIGWCVDQRAQLRWSMAQWAGCAASLCVVVVIVGSWWLDTHEAVALMQATEYPGKRGAMPGGDLQWWWHLRGYTNVETVLSMPGPKTDPSSASSFFLLPLLLIAFFLRNFRSSAQRSWMIVAAAAFVFIYWIYCFIGFPVWLAKYSLWGNMPTVRMDVGIGLAGIMAMAMMAGGYVLDGEQETKRLKVIGNWAIPGAVALASAILIAMAMSYTPRNIMPGGSIVYTVAMAGSGAVICWWMLRGRVAEGVWLLTIVHLLTTFAFNPFSKAPRDIELAQGNLSYVTNGQQPEKRLRTLLLNGDGIGALTLAAAGVPIANGVFYYPHERFWEEMGLPSDKWSVVNRYQHLGFYVDSDVQESDGYYVFSPTIDQVHVHIHPLNFNFAKSGADRVAVLAQHAQGLRKNPSLNWLGEFRGLNWFAVNNSRKP